MPIWFTSEIKPFKIKNKRALKHWVTSIIKEFKSCPGEINYIFVSDSTLLNMNKEYLKSTTLTDIISFDYSHDHIISGDIFISVERVRENAYTYKEGFNEELKRVIAHGILHFLGFKDKTDEEKTKMRYQENISLEGVKDLLIV